MLPQFLFDRFKHRNRHVVKDADSVNHHVSFLSHPFDFLCVVVTVIVAAVGDDEQGPARVSSGSHLFQADENSVQKGGVAVRHGGGHSSLQLIERIAGIRYEGGTVRDGDDKVVILRIGVG